MKPALAALALLGALIFGPNDALAQSRTGFAINRFEPAERGGQFFVNDTLDLRGALRPAVGATLDYGYKPLVVYDGAGVEHEAVVRHQLFTHLGGALVVADRLRFGLDVPVAVYQDGELATVGGQRLKPADKPAFGDLRLAADVRILGAYGEPFTFGAGVRAWLPTGQRSQFTGDGSARIGPQMMAAGDFGAFTYAAKLGLVYRARDDSYNGSPLGSEVLGSAGFGLKTLSGKLVIGPEVAATTVFTDSRSFFKTRGTPADWLFGLHYDAGDLRLGAAIGGGLTQGYGSPQLRALLSLEYAFTEGSKENADRDYDSIPNAQDACPDAAGPEDPDPKKNGCPPPPDLGAPAEMTPAPAAPDPAAPEP